MPAKSALRSIRPVLINLALLTASTLFAIVLSEAGLRLMGWYPLYVSPERDRFWAYNALLGWAHRPGQQGVFETRQFRTLVRINSRGLRDPERTYERLSAEHRLLVLGDSFAWGYGVEESERFSQRLEASMNLEVINAGVSGYSTDQELLWFQSEGVKYEVDIVVLVLAGNDIGDNQRTLVNNIYYKPRFELQGRRLILSGTPVPRTGAWGRFVYFASQRSALAYFLVQRYFDALAYYRNYRASPGPEEVPSGSPVAHREPFELTRALLNELRSTVEAQGAQFIIVATSRWWNNRDGGEYTELIDILRAADFLVIDVEALPGFDASAMVIPEDGHWNSAGHGFVATAIEEAVARFGLLNPPLPLAD